MREPPLTEAGRRLESAYAGDGEWRMHALVSHAEPDAPLQTLLIHGFAIASDYMAPTARLMPEQTAVYAPDLPGFGRSAKPSRALNVDELGDTIARFISLHDLRRPLVIANSFGCQPTIDLAVRYPGLVSAVILVGPTIDPAARNLPRLIGRWVLESRYEGSLFRLALRDYSRAGVPRLLETGRYAIADRPERRLPGVRVPVLVMRGSKDPIVSQQWTDEVVRLLPDGRFVDLPDAPHALNFTHPRAFVERVRPFLQELVERRLHEA